MKKFFCKLCLIVLGALLAGCGDSGEWIGKTGKNANGQSITWSQNTKTNEIGAASKACYGN